MALALLCPPRPALGQAHAPCPHVPPAPATEALLLTDTVAGSLCVAEWSEGDTRWRGLSEGEAGAAGAWRDRAALGSGGDAVEYAAIDADGDGRADVIRGVRDSCAGAWRDAAVWLDGAFRPVLLRPDTDVLELRTGEPLGAEAAPTLWLTPNFATRSAMFGRSASGVGDVFGLAGDAAGWSSGAPGSGDWLRIPIPRHMEAAEIELATPTGSPPLQVVVNDGGAPFLALVDATPRRFALSASDARCVTVHVSAVARAPEGTAPAALELARVAPLGARGAGWLRERFEAACDEGGLAQAEALGMEVAPRAPTVDVALVDFEGASPCAQAGLAAWLARVPGEAADRVAWVASAALTDGAADALAQAWSLPREVWLEAAEAAGGAQRARLLRAALGASCEGCAAQAAFLWPPSEAHEADRLLEGVPLDLLTALDALPAHRSSDDATLARRALSVLALASPSAAAPAWVTALAAEGLRSPDGSVARLAIGTIARHRLPGFEAELARLRDEDPDPPIRLEAWRTTVALSTPSARCVALDEAMADASPLVRVWAASVSGACAPETLARWLAVEGWPAVREAAMQTLLASGADAELAAWLVISPPEDVAAVAFALRERPLRAPEDWYEVARRDDLQAPALRQVVTAACSAWPDSDAVAEEIARIDEHLQRRAWLDGCAGAPLGVRLAEDALGHADAELRYAGFRALLATDPSAPALEAAAAREPDDAYREAMRADLEASATPSP